MPYKGTPEERRARRKAYRAKNAEHVNAVHRAWMQENYHLAQSVRAAYTEQNRSAINAADMSRYYARRLAIFEALGFVCAGCGHADWRVLEFDHIADDGAADRAQFKGSRSMYDYYARHLDEARARLQILCRNCNWLKRKGEPLPGRGGPTSHAAGRLLDGVIWEQFPERDGAVVEGALALGASPVWPCVRPASDTMSGEQIRQGALATLREMGDAPPAPGEVAP